MIKRISIEQYFRQYQNTVLLDTRTPAEFAKGHIPNAHSLPLFSNEERAKVGTTYKQESREAAILLGFDLVGNKWRGFIETALALSPNKKIAIHCWRGGMRSGVMAWALDLYGFEVLVIEGGYKAYRNWVLQQFLKPYKLLVLSGKTGSHKTEILNALENLGEQIVDLEKLAQHQGSAYGSMNKLIQPTQEQFENNFAEELSHLNLNKTIWVEDESITIGKIVIPYSFWQQKILANHIEIKIPREQRIAFLVEEYGNLDKQFLIGATMHIQKRLGPEQTKNALQFLEQNDLSNFIKTILTYYDKTYNYCISKKTKVKILSMETNYDNAINCAENLLQVSKTIS